MNLLAIDTATEKISMALYKEGEFFVADASSSAQHAERILLLVEQLLKKADLALEALSGIVFGKGPGSFTGVRIATSVAKGLAYALHLPLYPVSSLWAIAEEVHQVQDLPVLAVLDARMQQWYWSYITKEPVLGEDLVSFPKDICLPSARCVLAGVGFAPLALALPQALQSNIKISQEIYPNAVSMIRLVLAGRIAPVSAEVALPSYVRNQITGAICG
jgi:tRNA threonylcarbamoyladenosine biosynthesis protein TsaB